MKHIQTIRLVVALAGLVVWGYGYRYNDETVRLAGMGILAIALVLRFVRPRPTD